MKPKILDAVQNKASMAKLFLRLSLICFKCPSCVFFSDLNKKKWPHLFYSNIKIFILKMNKKGASLVFLEIKNKNLPARAASSVFQKSGLRNTFFLV